MFSLCCDKHSAINFTTGRLLTSSLLETGAGAMPIEAKQRSQRSVIRWVSNIYYLELLRASEGTLTRWFRLYLQSLTTSIRTGPARWVMARSPCG
jgi:hypothetical protein